MGALDLQHHPSPCDWGPTGRGSGWRCYPGPWALSCSRGLLDSLWVEGQVGENPVGCTLLTAVYLQGCVRPADYPFWTIRRCPVGPLWPHPGSIQEVHSSQLEICLRASGQWRRFWC